nr:hypothetical protein CFP56_23913 [Quercus suber]
MWRRKRSDALLRSAPRIADLTDVTLLPLIVHFIAPESSSPRHTSRVLERQTKITAKQRAGKVVSDFVPSALRETRHEQDGQPSHSSNGLFSSDRFKI